MAEGKAKEVLELQVPATFKNLIEALIFAAKEPLTIKQIQDIYGGEGPQAFLRHIDAEEIQASISDLNAEYERAYKPYRIVLIAGGYQFATSSVYADWIGRLYKEQARRKLSQSGIETLAIIAYKQPVTKADIESIRGVNCDYVLKTLLEKELVTIIGRAHAPGRPLLYGTTREFLRHFGLNEITDLPRPREIEEILGESQFETERRMLEAQAGIEKAKQEEPDFKSRLPHIPKKKSELDSKVEIKPKINNRGIRTIEPKDATDRVQEGSLFESGEQDKDISEEKEDYVSQPTSDVTPAETLNTLSEDLHLGAGVVNLIASEEEITFVDQAKMEKQGVEQSEIVEASPKETQPQEIAVESGETLESPPVQDPVVTENTPLSIQSSTATTAPSHPNISIWQSWKERVQGFIRKIFG
jgi:segregation and condensation protein B